MTRIQLVFLFVLALCAAWVAPAFATQFRPFLADTSYRDTDPAPSPDGQWLAFQSDRGKRSQIWLAPTQGGPPHSFTSEPESSQAQGGAKIATRVMTPTWAADGKSLVFVSTRTGSYNIYSMPIEGGGPKALSNAAGNQRFAVYSPDGKQICFPSSRLQPNALFGFNLYTMDAKGEIEGPPARQLTFSSGSPGHPVWSPDGHWIAYVGKDFDTTRTVNVGGGMQTKQSAIFSQYRVYKIPAAGGTVMKLSGLQTEKEPSEDTWPSWSPDGKWIAFGRNTAGKQNIWILDVATKHAFPLTSDGNCMKPTWSYDGKSIYYTRLSPSGRDEDIWIATDLSLLGGSTGASKKAPPKGKTTKK